MNNPPEHKPSFAVPVVITVVWILLGLLSVPVLIMSVMSLAAATTEAESTWGTIIYLTAWTFPVFCLASSIGCWPVWIQSHTWGPERHGLRWKLRLLFGLLPLLTFAALIVEAVLFIAVGPR